MVGDLPFAKKSLGQHWLEDEISLSAMVEAAHIAETDTVLEIGPGTGTLTEKLAATGARVIALEFDQQRYKELDRKYKKQDNIEVLQGDIRTYDLTHLPKSYKIVANIPYYLTANLLRKLVDAENQPLIAVLLVQKEVAQRIVAEKGDLSQVAVFTQVYYKPSLGQIVPADLFTPPPKVDSQILILNRREQSDFKLDGYFINTVKAGFSQKRKKLRSSLTHGLGIKREQAEQLLAGAHLSPDSRAQELSIDDWRRLTEKIKNS